MKKYFYVGFGGFFGALSRFKLGSFLINFTGLPWTTFIINLLGSYFLGFILTLFFRGVFEEEKFKWFAITGFLSSFTTFSTYTYEIITFIQDQQVLKAFAYSFTSVIFGSVFCWLGVRTGNSTLFLTQQSQDDQNSEMNN